MTVYEKLKQEQDSLLEKEGSMKMDQNLTVSYEEQKAQWQERKKQQQKENAGIFKKLAPASLIYALIYTVCIYKKYDRCRSTSVGGGNDRIYLLHR